MRSLNEVAEAALGLPERDRAMLAERLLESLEVPESADEEFVHTILARSEALDRGETTASDWRESMRRIRETFERRLAGESES